MRLEGEAFVRLLRFPLCIRCQGVLVGVDINGAHSFAELTREVHHKIKCQGYEVRENPSICLCCLNAAQESKLEQLADSIARYCGEKGTRSIKLEIFLPPISDAVRVAARGIICMDMATNLPFPTIEALMAKVLVTMLRRRGIVPSTHSNWSVSIVAEMDGQTQLLQALDPTFRPRKIKRKHWEADQPAPDLDAEPVSRASVDVLLREWKKFDPAAVAAMLPRAVALHQNLTDKGLELMRVNMIIHHAPVYMYGRYCKYARDVSQSPWALAEGVPEGDEDVDEVSGAALLKGRESVEDIIGQAVKVHLGAEIVKMHACGREDIDVRCLGNGRPFALEISKSQHAPTEERLAAIFSDINSRRGVNSAGDISLPQLQISEAEVWETMQKEAEEKDKRYVCVVWTEAPLTVVDLRRLELLSSSAVDASDRPCLQIIQKTPLRVLHRRSLIDRPRYIYNIQTAQINPHYFIMDLDTSAGTYVKEFVHGDLGRTLPSVSSVFGCQSQILQLDVTWLYDGFQERFPISAQQMLEAGGGDWSHQCGGGAPRLCWEELRGARQPFFPRPAR